MRLLQNTYGRIRVIQHLPYLLLTLITILLFLRIFETYAYTDVYEFLYNAGNENFINVFIQGGRPLYGLLNKFALTSIDSVSQLGWLRLFSILGLTSSVWLFYFLLKKYLLSEGMALFCTLVFLFSPSANIIGLWVATYQVGWGLMMALLGGYLTAEAMFWNNNRSRWLMVSSGVLLGLLSLFIYQPAFTAFVVPGLLNFIRIGSRKKTIYFLCIYLIQYLFYYGIHNLILKSTNLSPLSRAGLTNNLFDKLVWFFIRPVKMVYEDNFIFYPIGWRMAVAFLFLVLTLAAIYYLTRNKSYKEIIIMLLAIGTFLLFSYIPNLVSSDNWVSYRTLSTLFMLKWILVFYAIDEWQKQYGLKVVLVLAFGLLLLANSWYNINKGFVSIQTKEYSLIKTEVTKLIPEMKKKKQLVFIMPEFDFLEKQDIVRRTVSDEFGSLSTSRDWVPIPMVKQILREQNEIDLEKNLEVTLLSNNNREKIIQYKELPILNVEKLFSGIK